MNYFDEIKRHKTFISFRNPEAAWYKNKLIALNNQYNIFDNYSIGKGDIDRSDFKQDEEIRQIIIRDWVSDATVTILLVSPNMSESKFIDWEMQATMSDNVNNLKMGLLCIFLPEAKNILSLNTNTGNKYPDLVKDIVGGSYWSTLDINTIDEKYKDLPIRVRKNLKRESVKIDIISWNTLFSSGDAQAAIWIKKLIDKAFDQRNYNNYDISDKLQRRHK